MMATTEVQPIDPIEDEAAEIDTDCRVCLIRHDKAVHAATLRVHRRLRADLLKMLKPPAPKPPKPRVYEPLLDQDSRNKYNLRKPGLANKRTDVTVELVAKMKAQGMTTQQIRDKLHCSMNAVRDRIARANEERDRKRRNGAA